MVRHCPRCRADYRPEIARCGQCDGALELREAEYDPRFEPPELPGLPPAGPPQTGGRAAARKPPGRRSAARGLEPARTLPLVALAGGGPRLVHLDPAVDHLRRRDLLERDVVLRTEVRRLVAIVDAHGGVPLRT